MQTFAELAKTHKGLSTDKWALRFPCGCQHMYRWAHRAAPYVELQACDAHKDLRPTWSEKPPAREQLSEG